MALVLLVVAVGVASDGTPGDTPEPDLSEPWLGPVSLGSPRIVGPNVVVPHRDGFVAYEPESLVEVWRTTDCTGADWPGPIVGPEPEVVVGSCGGEYVGLDPATGLLVWRAAMPLLAVDRVRNGPSTLLVHGDGRTVVLDLADGRELWDEVTGEASVVADDQRFYVADNRVVTAHDIRSGEEVWSARFRANGIFADDSGVYARGQDQRLRRLDALTGDVLWITPVVAERLDTSEVVAVSDHAVVTLRSEERSMVTAFDRETGEPLWRYDERTGSDLPRGVYASAADATVAITDFDRAQTKVFDDATGLPVMDLGPPVVEWVAIDGDRLAFIAGGSGPNRLQTTHRP